MFLGVIVGRLTSNTMSLSRSTNTIAITILAGAALFLLATTAPRLLDNIRGHVTSGEMNPPHSHDFASIEDISIANETLGFERFFVIGLPERSDKRDALALTSSLTGIQLDWIDGVVGSSIPNSAVPYGVNRTQLWESNLGSWRSHMNAIRRIVEDKIVSALIIEDDMDWDVRLKIQLTQVAKGARYVQKSQSTRERSHVASIGSPYGDNWDFLWLGHCGEIFPETLPENEDKPAPRKYTIYPDNTLPRPHRLTGFQNYTEHASTRWVHVTGGPICSFAYALSFEGARKVLFGLSVDGLEGPFDNSLADLCRYGRGREKNGSGLGMRCISITPGLFFHHKAKGERSRDSDIQGGTDVDGAIREIGETQNIAISARLNLRNVLLGLEPEDQFID